jgi:adenylate cyclase, class 2
VPELRKTNREIEIKLPVSDIRATTRALKALGAVSHARVLEENTLYDTPQCDLRNSGRLLRLRIETPSATTGSRSRAPRLVLTSKAPPSQPRGRRKSPRYKERAERELIASHRDWPAALKRLGLEPSFRYEKYRTGFRLRGLHMDLDETPAGTFLELEGRPFAIDRAAHALGYQPCDYIRGTYWDVYVADCRRRGRKPKNMLFHAK